MVSELHRLALKHGTDKQNDVHTYKNMSYCDIYEKYLEKKRFDVKKVIEIGILNGSSLRMWKEYFPNAIIYGIDINPYCKRFEEDRIKCFIGSQNDKDFLNSVKEEVGEYDFLIDDGSHITRHQITSFDILYENCKPDGLYIIEDLRCSYETYLNHHDLRNVWPGMKYNDENDELKNYRNEFVDFIETHVKNLDFHKTEHLFAIHHYPMIVIFENKLPY
jgi:hypothetical protein